MTSQEILDLKSQFDFALNSAAKAVERADFYERILKQAVLTHGGELRVDPALSDEAEEDVRLLECGSGGVRLVAF